MATIAIAKGALWFRDGDGEAITLESPFAKEVVERDERSRRNSGWKHAPRGDQTGVIPTAALWGAGAAGQGLAPPRFHHACRGDDARTLYYVLGVGQSVGLFRQHLDDKREVRLFHRNQLPCDGLAYNRHDRRLVMANRNSDGTAHLEVYDDEGTRKGAITDGDSVDGAPSLVPGTLSTLVYHSAGVARHPQTGQAVATAHHTVNRLDYASGQLDTLLEDPKYDFIAPRMSEDGAVYAIRRPVEKPAHERAGSALKDTLMFPFRLGSAILGYLNFFSSVYGKEPLRSAGGPRTPQLDQDLGRLWLHGRMIELSKVRDDPQYAGNLVPRSWELVKLPARGRMEILMPHVASFDLEPGGALLVTNGYDLARWRDGARQVIGRHELIESVRVV